MSRLSATDAEDATLAGERTFEVGLHGFAINCDALVIDNPATEDDLGAVSLFHVGSVNPIERRVAQLAVKCEDGLVNLLPRRALKGARHHGQLLSDSATDSTQLSSTPC